MLDSYLANRSNELIKATGNCNLCCLHFNSERILACHWRRQHYGLSTMENFAQLVYIMQLSQQAPTFKKGMLMDTRDRLVRDVFVPHTAEQQIFFDRHQSGLEYLTNTLRLFLRTKNVHCEQFLWNLFEPIVQHDHSISCLLYTSPSPRDQRGSRMPSSA